MPPIPTGEPYPEDERAHFNLGLTTAPVIGVLLLLASTSIGGQVLRNGIVGIQGVKPYDIMTLFISLVSDYIAYIPAVVLNSNVLVLAGIHIHLSGLYWAFEVSCILGCNERRYLWQKALCLFLPLLLCVRCDRRKCEFTLRVILSIR